MTQIQHLIKHKQPNIYEILQALRGQLKNQELLEATALTDKEKYVTIVMAEKRAVEAAG